MRMRILLPLIGLLALGACKDEKKAEKTDAATPPAASAAAPAGPTVAQSPGEKTGANSALGVSPSTADFVTQAAISDMFEIQTSQLALQQSAVTAQRVWEAIFDRVGKDRAKGWIR